MKVTIDGWAWINKQDLPEAKIQNLRDRLTLTPYRYQDGDREEPTETLRLYEETETRFGMAREFYMGFRRPDHEVEFRTTLGDRSSGPGPLVWNPEVELRPGQREGLAAILSHFKTGLGGMAKAKPGFGKTILALAVSHALQVPTLVFVQKDFLLHQWMERIFGNPKKGHKPVFLNAQVGIVKGSRCEFDGKHIVIASMQSLARRDGFLQADYPEAFYRWPGLVVTDEAHHVGAQTWTGLVPRFPAHHRLGVTATPKRKDRLERAFFEHIGPIIFESKVPTLPFKVKRVWTEWGLPRGERVPQSLVGRNILIDYMIRDKKRNELIVQVLGDAVRSGRSVVLLSERREHLETMASIFRERNPEVDYGFHVGGLSQEERDEVEMKRVMFATYQNVAEAFDCPHLDTAFFCTPCSDPEQPVGRIQREHPDKKPPIVVDFRDDRVRRFKDLGERRERFYVDEGALP